MKKAKTKKEDENNETLKENLLNQDINNKPVEISEESQQERAFLTGMLLEKKEDLIKAQEERIKKRNEEIIELYGGRKVTYKNYIAEKPRVYKAEFPNHNLFFPEIFRINFPDLDPKSYRKPKIVGKYIKEIIYGRFRIEVYPILDALNPIQPGGGRELKLYQNLNDDGLEELRRFRDEAIAIMKTCKEGEWYKFRKELYRKHGVGYQLKIDENND